MKGTSLPPPKNGERLNAILVCIGLLVLFLASAPAMAADDYANNFGQKAIDWIAFGTFTPTWGQESLLSAMSKVINAIALCVMAWLAIIGGASFVIHTANKGVPGGQIISSFWMPIRIGTATILLIPLTSGYSSLQYGVITVAEKGNEHGNLAMNAGLNYLYDFGVYRSPALEDGRSTVLSWIESEVCRQYINSYTKKETVTPKITSNLEGDQYVTRISYPYSEASTWMWKSNPRTDYCGAISFSVDNFSDSISADMYSAKYGAPSEIANNHKALLGDLLPKIQSIASLLLSDESALRALQAQGKDSQSTYERAAAEVNNNISSATSKLNEAVSLYNSLTQSAIAQAVNKLNDKKNAHKSDDGDSSGWREQTKAIGWPALGTIFWQINLTQSEINKLAATMSATYTSPQLDQEWLQDQRLSEISGRIRGLNKQSGGTSGIAVDKNNISIPSLSAIADAGSEGDGMIDKVKSLIYRAFALGLRAMLYKNSPDDLIINMQYFGSAAATFAETGWWAKTIATSGLVGTLGAVDKYADAAKDFAWYNPIGWVAKAAAPAAKGVAAGMQHFLIEVSSLIDYLLTAMLFTGFLLAVVLPTIPLTSWFMGVMSWMLFYLECLLISPLWLAAHGTAEREGWGTEHTRQGYMLMIGLYLNPIFRVAGFFGIFMLLRPAAYLVSWFIDYLQGVVISGFSFLFITIGSLIVAGIFAYNLLTRAFNLPSELFEHGLRWVNGGQEVTGDGHNEERTRNNIVGFIHTAKGVTSGGGGGLRALTKTKPADK